MRAAALCSVLPVLQTLELYFTGAAPCLAQTLFDLSCVMLLDCYKTRQFAPPLHTGAVSQVHYSATATTLQRLHHAMILRCKQSENIPLCPSPYPPTSSQICCDHRQNLAGQTERERKAGKARTHLPVLKHSYMIGSVTTQCSVPHLTLQSCLHVII